MERARTFRLGSWWGIPLVGFVAVLVYGGYLVMKPAPNDAVSPYAYVRPVSTTDHTRGNPGAPIQLIVYTDLECKYCKLFHREVLPLLEERYGSLLQVVYRHYPMPSRPRGLPEAIASECAARVGGEAKYWEYVDAIYSITPSDNKLDPEELIRVAESIDLDMAAFSVCRSSDATAAQVQEDVLDGVKAGVLLTPSMLVRRGDNAVLVEGSYHSRIVTAIENMKSIAPAL